MTTSIVHVSIQPTQGNSAELRVFGAVASDYGTARSVTLDDVRGLVGKAETDYYTTDRMDLLTLGRRLYAWVNGSDRVLSRAIASEKPEVIAISAVEGLAHLPWEVLADGAGFLVDRGMVPVRWVSEGRDCIESVSVPKVDALKLMLMATDPTGSQSLQYEVEEARILEATARAGLELVVEESGCLDELALLVRDYGAGYFDAFHLTGHATSEGTEPTFGMESQTGDLVQVTAREIAKSFNGLPTLVFLSGCQTGKLGAQGAVASMAGQLVAAGAQAVLGWGETVDDREASLAAEIFYGELAAGMRVDRALAKTYDRLMNAQRDYGVRDWHKLRLYVGDRLPGELVVPLRLRKKKAARVRLAESEFLDEEGRVKVASRSTFVGRRRILQRVLRLLQDQDAIGVMLYGLGGNGKSSVAARVCDRLAASALKYQRVVIFGAVTAAGFENAFSRALVREPECVKVLSEGGDLRSRLVRVLEMTTENWLFVMDDFEALSSEGVSLNLDEVASGYVMKPGVAAVMGAIAEALYECGGRLLVTSRYEVPGIANLTAVPLGPMDDREMSKKRRQLGYVAKIAAAIESQKSAMTALQARAEALADGNPRLVMWLDRVLCEMDDPIEILTALEERAIEFRENVLAEKLLALLTSKERKALARGLVFELAVPRAVFESVVAFREFDRSIALGLLAVSPDGGVRVVRLLGLEEPQDEALAAKAAKEMYRAWWEESETSTELQCLEMYRLAIAGKEGAIAVEIGSQLAHNRCNSGLYYEMEALSRSTLEVSDSYLIWHQLAQSLHYRDINQAAQLYSITISKLPPGDLDDESLKEKAAILHNFAVLKVNQGKLEEALKLYEESLQIQQTVDDQKGIAANLHAIGNVKFNQGKLEESVSYYEESRQIQCTIDNQEGIAANLHARANINIKQGKVEEAIFLYEDSLEIERAIGNQHRIAMILKSLGCAKAFHQKDFGTAIDYLQQSEAILRRIGSPEAEKVARILQWVEEMRN